VPDILADAAPLEVCDARPHAMPAVIKAPPSTATASADVSSDLSADIVEMERAVGQFIRDAGNPAERDLCAMLKNSGKKYTQKQIRIWKRHFGAAADAVPATVSGQTASSTSTSAQLMNDAPIVPADIQEMEKHVGPFIRNKGNPQERVLYAMLKDEGHHYTWRQVRLWKQHYCTAPTASANVEDIDADMVFGQAASSGSINMQRTCMLPKA